MLSDTPYNMGFPPKGAETITIFALQAIGDETVNWAALASSALIAALPVMVISFFTIDRVIKSDSERSKIRIMNGLIKKEKIFNRKFLITKNFTFVP